jgi:hypothetical protein
MNKLTLLRYIGNSFIIFGYYTILWGDLKYGLIIKVLAGILLFPSFVKLKMWDSVVICSFFFTIEFAKLLQIFLVNTN